MNESIKKQIKFMLVLILIGAAIISILFLIEKKDTIINYIDNGSTEIKQVDLTSRQLSWNGITLRDDTKYFTNGSCIASYNGMTAQFNECEAKTMSGRNIQQEAVLSTNRSEGTTFMFIYEGKLESGSMYVWRNYSHTYLERVLQDSYINNVLIDNVVSYNDLGTPDSRCQLGSTHNAMMYQVERYDGTGTTTKMIYCFSARTVVNATSFRVSGNRSIETFQSVTGFKYDWDDVTNLVSDVTDNMPTQLKRNFSFYKVTDVSPGTYKTKWVFTPKGNSTSGKWHILAYPTTKGVAQAYADSDYMYQDPTWTSSLNTKILAYYKFDNTTGTGDSVGLYGNLNGSIAGTVTRAAGKIMDAYSFAGGGDVNTNWITIGDGNTLKPPVNFSFNVWTKPNSFSNGDSPMCWNAPSNVEVWLWGGQGDTGLLNRPEVRTNIGGSWILATTPATTKWTNGVWMMVTVVVNDTHITIYANGSYAHSVAMGGVLPNSSTTNWTIGGCSSGAGEWNGVLDEIGFWNRTLSASEVSDLFNGGAGISYTTTAADADYPIFSNIKDNTGIYYPGGTAVFNVTVTSTNGTVYLTINGTNYMASNTTATLFNVTIPNLINRTYSYNWTAYGNGTSMNSNTSATSTFTVNKYPTPAFTAYTDNNGSVASGGVATFTATITNANGTAYLSINGSNYYATNSSATSYSVSVTGLINQTYTYNWTAFGRTFDSNISATRSYTVLAPSANSIIANLISPVNNSGVGTSLVTLTFNATTSNLNHTNTTIKLWDSSYNLLDTNYSYDCYQETANASTASDGNCGLNYTGSYGGTNVLGVPTTYAVMYDGNYSTGQAIANEAQRGTSMLINYSFPTSYNNVKFRIKFNTSIEYNLTVNSSCLTKTNGKLEFIINSTASRTVTVYCMNNTGRVVMFAKNYNTASDNNIYEEGVYWNIKTDSISYNLSDGRYYWGINVCGANTGGASTCSDSANNTFNVDTIAPILTLLSPARYMGYGYVGQNFSINFTYTETNPDSCWYNYNGVNYAVSCLTNSSFILSVNKSFTFSMNDTSGRTSSTALNMTFDIFEYNQTFNASARELSRENFYIDVLYNNSKWDNIAATFYYNNVSYGLGASTRADIETGRRYLVFNKTINLPFSGINDLYWQFALTNTSGTYYYNSSLQTQVLNQVSFGFCNTTLNVTVVNFSVYDAETPTKKVNSTFYITFKYWSGNGDSSVSKNYTYQHTTANVSSFKFCNLLSTTVINVDADIRFSNPSYAQNYHYYRNVTLSSNTTEQTLYLLNSSKATITELQVVNNFQDGVPEIITQIQRYDSGTNTYYLVGMAKSNYEGKDFVYLNWYDTFYKFIGVDSNNTIIFNYAPYRIGETPQIFRLGSSITYSYEKFGNMQTNLYYNNDTKNVVFTFVDPSGSITSACLRIRKISVSSPSTIYDTCLSATSGTIAYNMGNYTGNFEATVYATGSFGVLDSIQFAIEIAHEVYNTLSKVDAAIYAFLVVLGAVFLGLYSPSVAIVFSLVGWVGASWLGFVKLEGAQIYIFIGIAVIGGYIAWKLRN